jgi:hypothetical protein
MTTQDFTTEQRKALHKIELLLRKASGNANEHEAAVATQLAQDLLAKYNLDMESVGGGDGSEAQREDTKILGGFSEFERDLWKAIAELNWCFYFSTFTSDTIKGRKMSRAHRLIGKKVNILSTKLMADYLLSTINSLAKEYCMERDGTYHNRSATATSFRKGAVERLVGKLQTKRYEILMAERAAEKEAAARGTSGTGMAMTMTRMSQSEYERNYDHMNGEGAYARAQARNAEWDREQKERDERARQWRLANPEEAARLDAEAEEKQRKEDEKWERRSQRTRREKPAASDMSAYHEGYRVARDIGLDKQVKDTKTRGLIG